MLDGSSRSRWRSLVGVTLRKILNRKGVDQAYANLILSERGLRLAKKSRLLGCCKVPDGCQTHLGRAKVKIIVVESRNGKVKVKTEDVAHLAGCLRLLSSSRCNISGVEPGQLLHLWETVMTMLSITRVRLLTNSSFRLAGLPPCCCCWLEGGSGFSASEATLDF